MVKKFLFWLFKVSDVTDCVKPCFYYRRHECHFYGQGHRAKYPCPNFIPEIKK